MRSSDRAAMRDRSTWVQPSNRGTRASRFTMGRRAVATTACSQQSGWAASAGGRGSGVVSRPLGSGPMAGAFMGLAESLSRLLSRRRVAAFAITAGSLVLVADAIRKELSGDAEVGALTWAAVALMAYAVVAVVFLQRRAPENIRLVVAWFIGLSPALYGMTAALAGSPVIVMWFGVVLAIGLVGWVALRTTSGESA